MSDNWQIIQYEPEHAMQIIENNMRLQEKLIPESDMKKWSYLCKESGPAYTLMVDDVPVVCAGIVLQEWDKGEAWSLLSSLFYRHKVKAYRAIKAGLEAFIAEKRLKRVQSVVDPEFQPAIDFIECLGFEYEGRLRKYGPAGDYLMYARTQ